MSLKKIRKKIAALDPSFSVTEERGCIVLRGEAEDWNKIVKAGSLAVDKKHSLGVINDITLKGFHETMKVPAFRDQKLDGLAPDVLVIGAGITGCSIARELSRWDLNILVLDKGADVAAGATKANGGVIHAGVNFGKNSQKHYYNARGNAMYRQLSEELHFPMEQKGQVMLDVDKWERLIVKYLSWNARKNLDMPNVRYLKRDQLHKVEPHVPSFFDGGMFLPIAGVTSPYGVCIAMAENAVQNGARFSLETVVEDMTVENGKILAVKTNRGTLYPKVVCNAAGVYADKIADMAGDRTFTIHPRRGTDIITDVKAGHLVKTSMAKAPFAVMPDEKADVKGKPWKYVEKVRFALGSGNHTKGVGLIHSVYGNMLVGPNATETPERENTETRAGEFQDIMNMQMKLCPELR
ncbi:MAG TPA: FAD-dependent oxidoreductase, partial [Clostridiales bacterium]|nr:FAD-dependent oxidoreductase [Clostridiales bacterium]